MYLESITLLIAYSTINLAIGERDGVDCSRRLWMTCSIYGTRHQSLRLGIVLVVGDVGQFFFIEICVAMT